MSTQPADCTGLAAADDQLRRKPSGQLNCTFRLSMLRVRVSWSYDEVPADRGRPVDVSPPTDAVLTAPGLPAPGLMVCTLRSMCHVLIEPNGKAHTLQQSGLHGRTGNRA